MCDVGTDHGYLPCYLVKNQIAERAVAADVNEKPLQTAARTIAQYGLQDKVKTVLSDGLAQIGEAEADDIVIAGMGGELIARICASCPWLKGENKRLILQPMTCVPFLRKFLYQNGFEILAETPVFENGHCYTVMLCRFCGKTQEIDEVFSILGKIPQHQGEEAEKYIRHQKEKLMKIAQGMKASSSCAAQAAQYLELAQQVAEYIEEKRR